jgi:hypothetical protein
MGVIQSKYLKTLLFALPGAYLAIWLSRIALGIVNNSQYYYGLIFCFIALLTGYATGLLLIKRHKNISWEGLTLLGISCFFIEELNIIIKMLILGFIGGAIFYDITKEYRKFFIGGFITGGVTAFLLGGDLFINYRWTEIFIGLIIVLYSLARLEKRKHIITVGINIILFGFFTVSILNDYSRNKIPQDKNTLISHTTLGNVRIEFGKDDAIKVYDHRNNLIDYRENYFNNNNMILPVLLQRNAKDLQVLYVGFAPSIMPMEIFNSPLVNKIDILYWGGLDTVNSSKKINHRFPGTEILLKYFNKNSRYDVIFIENLPKDDYISQRIFLRYAKKLLRDNQGIIVFPEYLVRPYDGRYIKPYAKNKLVFPTNATTEEYGEKLKNRYLNLLNIQDNNNSEVNALLDEVIPEKFVIPETIRASELMEKPPINIHIEPKLLKMILIIALVVYLIFRVFCSRYRDNNYLFYGFENGYSLLIVSLGVLVLISEYRLVYCFFTPALISLLGFLMISYKSKVFEFICTLAWAWVFAYMLIPNLILTLQPFAFLLPFWVLALMTAGNTIKEIGKRMQTMDANIPRYCTLSGVLVGLLLMLFCRNQDIFAYLIYGAMLFRVMYLLKI